MQPPLNDLQRQAHGQHGGRYSRGLPRRGDRARDSASSARVGPKHGAAQIDPMNTMPAVDRGRPRRSRRASSASRATATCPSSPPRSVAAEPARPRTPPLLTPPNALARSGPPPKISAVGHPPGIRRAQVEERLLEASSPGNMSCSASRLDHGGLMAVADMRSRQRLRPPARALDRCYARDRRLDALARR